MTNLERIKEMSLDQLAELIQKIELGDLDYAKTFCDMCDTHDPTNDCDECCKMWLQRDSKEPFGLDW